MTYDDAVIAIGIGIWLSVIAGSIVLFGRFAVECWLERRRRVREDAEVEELWVRDWPERTP